MHMSFDGLASPNAADVWCLAIRIFVCSCQQESQKGSPSQSTHWDTAASFSHTLHLGGASEAPLLPPTVVAKSISAQFVVNLSAPSFHNVGASR